MSSFIKLFGKPIAIKSIGCNHLNFPGAPIPPSVNIFVKVTNGCNAHCSFCSNAGARTTSGFDIDKLFNIIDEARSQQLII